MKIRQVVGVALVASPFIGVAVIGYHIAGAGAVIFTFSSTFAIVAVVSAGCFLMSK